MSHHRDKRQDTDEDSDEEVTNICDLPPVPVDCHYNVINNNSGIIPKYFKPFKEINQGLFKCNFCEQVISHTL